MKKRGLILGLVLALMCAGNVRPAYAETITSTVESPEQTEHEPSEEIVRFTIAPSGIAKDSKGNMYIADRTGHVLYKRTKSGSYTVLAGQTGVSGYKNGSAKKALFQAPWDVVSYKEGWLISDSENHALRLYQDGKVTTLAGTGKPGYKNGKKAQFRRPTGMAVGKNGEIYVCDTGNHVIRKIDKNGKVTTFAGTGKAGCADGSLTKARFYEPTGLCYYKGVLYVADSGNHRICRIENGKVTTVVGSAKGVEGAKDARALKARLSNPQEMFLYKDIMYISDTGNGCVRELEKGTVTTLIPAFSLEDGREPAEPCGLTVQGGKLYVGDIFAEDLIPFDL